MSLAAKFVIALMTLVTAVIGYQTELLGMTGGGSSEPTNFIQPQGQDTECIWDGSYDACGGSH